MGVGRQLRVAFINMAADQSFLARRLSQVKASSGPVPAELLESWVDADGNVPAAFLLHPAVRSEATENDVRQVLKHDLTKTVSSKDFTKLAARVHKRRTSITNGGKPDDPPAESLSEEVLEAVEALRKLTAQPKWRENDAALGPALFAPWLLCGSAEHAADLGALRKAGVTAVFNCASAASEDPVETYDEYGIAYAEIDGEDFEGYPLLELHLEQASKFVDEHSANGGVVLVYATHTPPSLSLSRTPTRPRVRVCLASCRRLRALTRAACARWPLPRMRQALLRGRESVGGPRPRHAHAPGAHAAPRGGAALLGQPAVYSEQRELPAAAVQVGARAGAPRWLRRQLRRGELRRTRRPLERASWAGFDLAVQ